MRVYMLVTADKYELPLAVCDTVVEIARLLCKQPNEVYVAMGRKAVSQETHNGFRYKIIKVDIDEEDEDGESREDQDNSQALHQE